MDVRSAKIRRAGLAAACCVVSAASRSGLAPVSVVAGRVMVLGLRHSWIARRKAAFPSTMEFSASSSSSPVNINPTSRHQDDLTKRVKAAIACLPRRPRCAVVGGGFAGLATAYHLARFGSDVTIFDPNDVGTGGASAVAAGLLHPLTSRGKVIFKGEEGLAAAKELIEVANAGLTEAAEQGRTQGPRSCIASDNIYRPLLDEKQYSTFTKAAQELPQWLQYLTREEFLEAVPGSDTECLGGVRIRGALAVDAPLYLRGLWDACRSAASANRDGGGTASTGGGATWVRQRVDNIHTMASSGEFDAVVACVGADVKVVAGVKDIVNLRLVRGQTLLYDNVNPDRTIPPLTPGASTADSVKGQMAPMSGRTDGKMLESAILCGQYVVPAMADGKTGNVGKLLYGSTQEPVLLRDVDKPADMAQALRQLAPKIAKLFPALEGVEPVGVSSGVRVIQDRTEFGRIPIAGRLPFSRRGWVIAALGARGLIHHAYLGRLVATCALLDSDQHLPPQVISPLEDLGNDPNADL